ncbi:alpha/beta hydrolase [Cognatishimia sp. D5M38]|uniref:Alpha/beta hydrolase n=1 Tax=Cognatishimia coralii TaxID=3083254 RepID=A0ABU8QCZ6_9RHOB
MRILLILAILILGLAALTVWRAARNEAQARIDTPPLGEIIEVEGHDVHALVKGSGPDLVLIHGSSGNIRDFTHSLVDQLTDRYRVIVLDRPGLGYSEAVNPKGDTIFEQAAILQKAAAQLGADKPIVVGQSYGGTVALAWSADHPDALSALVTLAAPAEPWDTPLAGLYEINSNPWLSWAVLPVISAWVPNSHVQNVLTEVFAPQPVPEGYLSHFGRMTLSRGSQKATALQRKRFLDEVRALKPRYGQITVPTEVLHGDADDTVNIDLHTPSLLNAIDGAQLTTLPGIGHMPQHVAQEAVLDAIDRAATRAALR